MVPVRAVIPGVLSRALLRAPLCPEKVAFAWRHAVGASVDRATIVELQDKVLVVRARDHAWKREVERALPLVRPRLDEVLGSGIVRRIEVSVAGS